MSEDHAMPGDLPKALAAPGAPLRRLPQAPGAPDAPAETFWALE